MAIILLIRHGENDWVGKKLAGHLPGVHLNQTGINQANEVANLLAPLPIKAIYSSPLERARETAQPLAEIKKLEIDIREDLREINFGDWQGKSIKQLRRMKLWRTVQSQPSQMRFPNGESFPEAQHRLVSCIQKLAEEHQPEELIACFSHSDSIRLVVSHFLDIPLDSFQKINISTASISTLILTKEHVSLPFINMVDRNKFLSQFEKKEKVEGKTKKRGKRAQ